MLRGLLAAEGRPLGRRHISTLMRRMGIEALYRRPRTTKPERRRGAGLRPDATRSIRIFCAACRWIGRTKSGRWTSPTFRWPRASSISPSCSTGQPVACWRDACRSRWRRRSASKRWRTRWPSTAPGRFSTPIRAAILPARRSLACWRSPFGVRRSCCLQRPRRKAGIGKTPHPTVEDHRGRLRQEYGVLKLDQVKLMKELEQVNVGLRRAPPNERVCPDHRSLALGSRLGKRLLACCRWVLFCASKRGSKLADVAIEPRKILLQLAGHRDDTAGNVAHFFGPLEAQRR